MTPLAERLAWARNEGRAHEREYQGHTTTELDTSTHAEAAVTMVCDVCRWTVSAGGPREDAPNMGAGVTELTVWLLARIAEDEQDAHAAHVGRPWSYDGRTMSVEVGSDSLHWQPSAADHAADCDYEDHWECSDARKNARIEGDHIVRWQPSRVLSESEAKRRIIELHGRREDQACFDRWDHAENRTQHWHADVCAQCGHPDAWAVEWPCETLRLLALPYADRPGYREEWRP